jgi:hypothetical protein
MDALRLPYDENTTRGEASSAITEAEEGSPHPFSEEALQ